MSAQTKPLIAIAQLCSTSYKISNLTAITRLAKKASEAKASFLFLPEAFAFMGESSSETLANAEVIPEVGATFPHAPAEIAGSTHDDNNDPSPTITHLQSLAKNHNMWISGGGLHESNAPVNAQGNPRVWNTHVIIDNYGTIRGKYRKVHLFDISLPDQGVRLKESDTTAPGTEYCVVKNTPVGTLGVGTCYDLRFSDMATKLVREGGADVLLYPSAFTVPTGLAHWHSLLRGRAVEHQVFTVAAAQCGKHNKKRRSFGHALAVDPWGVVLGDAGGYEEDVSRKTTQDEKDKGVEGVTEKIIVCEIDLERVKEVRRKIPIAEHRRLDVGLKCD